MGFTVLQLQDEGKAVLHNRVLFVYFLQIEVDTNHFKGNFPDSCVIEGRKNQNQLSFM